MESTLDHLVRNLAGEYADIDYSILSVVVLTLGLILVVEICRHQLDEVAKTRTFLHAVLGSVYQELSTLGIVEAGIYVLHAYYADLDIAKEKVFADVHFLLFFTAVFNAFQSCILAVASARVSDRMWSKTEDLDLLSYIAVREEFERLEEKLHRYRASCSPTGDALVRWMHLPSLMHRSYQLRLQVRFHELRVHFLKANNLPLFLRISDYLKRREVEVFSELCHTSTLAWIFLTGAVSLSYFLLGMVIYVSDADEAAAGEAMTQIYIWGNVFIVAVSLLLFKRMNYILSKIMQSRIVVSTNATERPIEEIDQEGLFWGGEPQSVISVIQFTQFVSSISMAILLVFWNKALIKGDLAPVYLAVIVFTCYCIFVTILAFTIPRFIMCSSLGQLIHQDTLDETVANYRWHEAKRTLQLEAEDDASSKRNKADTIGASISITGSLSYAKGENESAKLSHLSTLVETETSSLRATGMPGVITVSQSERRLRRKKSYSDSSVARMRSVGNFDDEPSAATTYTVDTLFIDHSIMTFQPKLLSSNRDSTEISSSQSFSGDEKREEAPQVEGVAQSRRRRPKSASLGVDVMRKVPIQEVDSAFFEDLSDDEEMQVNESESANKAAVSNAVVLDITDLDKMKTLSGSQAEPALVSTSESIKDGPSPKEEKVEIETRPVLLRTAEMFESRSYRYLSCLCGTLPCFLFVGMRMEGLLIADGSIYTPEKTFQVGLHTSFWLQFSWLIMFLLTSSLMVATHWTTKRKDLRVAAYFDFGNTALCLALLLLAESQRCCDELDLGCCGAFGSRSHGSVGNIEPFSSMIMLRLLRFYVGKLVAPHKKSAPVVTTHHGGSMLEKQGTIVDLWQHAIILYPQVAETHGIFSEELLRAMLGLMVQDGDTYQQPRKNDFKEEEPHD